MADNGGPLPPGLQAFHTGWFKIFLSRGADPGFGGKHEEILKSSGVFEEINVRMVKIPVSGNSDGERLRPNVGRVLIRGTRPYPQKSRYDMECDHGSHRSGSSPAVGGVWNHRGSSEVVPGRAARPFAQHYHRFLLLVCSEEVCLITFCTLPGSEPVYVECAVIMQTKCRSSYCLWSAIIQLRAKLHTDSKISVVTRAGVFVCYGHIHKRSCSKLNCCKYTCQVPVL